MITEKIKTYEDALLATGRPDITSVNFPDDLKERFLIEYKLIVITEALNEGWEPDFNDIDQIKYWPVFYFNGASAGLFLVASTYAPSYPIADLGSRLCFKSKAIAKYAGKQFFELYLQFLTK